MKKPSDEGWVEELGQEVDQSFYLVPEASGRKPVGELCFAWAVFLVLLVKCIR
jgi:hypothetical protein